MGSVSRGSYYWQRQGSLSLSWKAVRCPTRVRHWGVLLLNTSVLQSLSTSPSEGNPLRLHSHDQRSVTWSYLQWAGNRSWSTPVHVTIKLGPVELVLPRRAMIKLILEIGLALHGAAAPRRPNKSVATNSCFSIKDLPHTKLTCHWKITESWSFIIDKA